MVIHFITMNTIDYNTAVNSSEFKIIYGIHSSPFGNCLIGIAHNQNAICHLWFVDDDSSDDCLKIMAKEWPGTKLIEETQVTDAVLQSIFHNNTDNDNNISVLLKGTEFQICVWKALMTIPKRNTVTYSEVAKLIRNPKAIRAVATAIANNRIAYLVPCHRVLPKTRSITKFRWGSERRFAILNYEKEND